MAQGQAQWADNSLISSFLKEKINPVVPVPVPVSAPTTAVPSHQHDVPECAAGYRCAHWPGFGEARLAPTYHWFVATPELTFRESNMLLTDINFWFNSTLDQWPK